MNLDPDLMAILVCPACHGELRPVDLGPEPGLPGTPGELVCTACRLAYPVREDIPILLVDEARPAAS
ncbi:MAG: Trm112 family protein [Actinomycetes bacterium]